MTTRTAEEIIETAKTFPQYVPVNLDCDFGEKYEYTVINVTEWPTNGLLALTGKSGYQVNERIVRMTDDIHAMAWAYNMYCGCKVSCDSATRTIYAIEV